MVNWKHVLIAAATAASIPAVTFGAGHDQTWMTALQAGLVFVGAFCAALMKGLGQ